MAVQLEDISAALDNKSISDTDMVVVNAARQSFAKQKDIHEPLSESDKGLLRFLATGLTTDDWGSLIGELGAKYAQLFAAQSVKDHEFVGKKHDEIRQRLEEFKRTAVHFSPFAHCHLRLRLRFPIFLARQLVKHQVGGAWSEESRRYIDEEPTYFIEPTFHLRPEQNIKQGAGEPFDEAMQEQLHKEVLEFNGVVNDFYKKLVQTYRMAPEEARENLTLNHMTGVTWTGSLLFWARVYNLRVDAHAQGIAQRLAAEIDRIIRPLFPESWAALTGKR